MPMPETATCICATLGDLAVVPMGGDGLDERFFATVESILGHGGEQWWLHLARCAACGQDWMLAQEERIYDDHFVKRLSREQAEAILGGGAWPPDFLTYEAVLRIGQARSSPCHFLDPRAGSLLWAVEDLQKARPGIGSDEIAELLGIADSHAARLMRPERWPARIVRRLTMPRL